MHLRVWQAFRVLIASVFVVIFALPLNLAAQIHVIKPGDLQKATTEASKTRERNLQQVTQFLSSERAQEGLKAAHINPTQVKAAVSTLNDEELAKLASRSAKAEADFAAGRLEDRDLLLIILAVAALALIIVAAR